MKTGWKQPPRQWISKDCKVCHAAYTPRSSSQQTCSDRCSLTYQEKQRKQKKKQQDQQFLSKYFLDNKGFLRKELRKHKLRVRDARVIDYDSPSGKAYIGVAKAPLQVVDHGFGFKGVLIQTDNRTLCQCHVCGKWFRRLAEHIKKLHQMERADYCKEFGLNIGNGLISDDLSYQYEAASRKAWENPEYRTKRVADLKNRQPKAVKAFIEKNSGRRDSIEEQNKSGTCDLQLQYRLIEYIKHFKDLPSRSSKKGEGRTISKALFRRYGSLNEGFKHYGLPARHRTGTNVEFIAPNREQYFFNYNKNYNKNEVYQWLVKHCPILSQVNTLPVKE